MVSGERTSVLAHFRSDRPVSQYLPKWKELRHIMANFLTQEAIASQVEDVIRAHVGADEVLTPETHLQDDLAVDSLERMELGIKLEKAFGIELANEKIRRVSTLGDFIQLVSSEANLREEAENRI